MPLRSTAHGHSSYTLAKACSPGTCILKTPLVSLQRTQRKNCKRHRTKNIYHFNYNNNTCYSSSDPLCWHGVVTVGDSVQEGFIFLKCLLESKLNTKKKNNNNNTNHTNNNQCGQVENQRGIPKACHCHVAVCSFWQDVSMDCFFVI